MEEAKQLASVVDLVVSVNYNTLHIHRTWCSPVPARACSRLWSTIMYVYASVCMRLWCVYLPIYIILYSHIRIHDSYFSSSTTNRYVSILLHVLSPLNSNHLFSGRHRTRIHSSNYCYSNSDSSSWCGSCGINCWNNYHNYNFCLEKGMLPFADI